MEKMADCHCKINFKYIEYISKWQITILVNVSSNYASWLVLGRKQAVNSMEAFVKNPGSS